MTVWDPLRAWRFVRASKAYREAWRRHAPPPGLPEPAPFPVRLQTGVDLAALEWGLLAWEDPYASCALSPFWARAPMAEGMVAPGGPPLAALAAADGAALSGLRTADGALVVKVERPGRAVQLRIPGGGAFPEDGGLLFVRRVASMEDVWSGAAAPRPGRVRGTGIASFCWRWKARRRGFPTARSRRRSGARSGPGPSIAPTAGCIRGSSAA